MKMRQGIVAVGLFSALAAGTWVSADGPEIASLALPSSLGKIQERFVGTSPHWVIHIQDVHQHLSTQENIAAIIEHLNTVYGIKTVALEGCWSASSLPASRSLPSSMEKQSLAHALLEDGHLSGPPYTALFSQTPIELIGIEEKSLYEENRQTYLKHLSARAETATRLKELEDKYREKKTQIFNPDLKSLDDAAGGFREGKKAEALLPLLISLAENRGVGFTDLSEVALFSKIARAEKGILKEKLDAEARRLAASFQGTGMNFEELLLSGSVPQEKLEFYPETQKYLELLKLQSTLSYTTFFHQLDEAVRRLKEKLFVSDEERLLDAAWARFSLAKKILLFQAAPSDLRNFESERAQAEAEIAQARLQGSLELALRFYESAKQRDDVFFEKITTDPRLAGDLVVVSGGFHTEGLTEKLREAGVSFVVIAPDLARQSLDEELYFKRLQDEIRTAQALSDAQNRFLIPEFDAGFVKGVEVLKATRNLNGAKREVLSAVGLVTAPERPREAKAWQGIFKDFSVADFLALPRADQKSEVRKWLATAGEGKLAIVMILKTSDAANLFKNNLALAVWEKFVARERANTIGELRDIDEYLSEMVGIKARIIRIPALEAEADIDAVIEKHFSMEKSQRAVAVIANDYPTNDWVLGLPLEPASLLIARLVLEQGLPRILPPGFQKILNEVLREIFVEDRLIERAA